MTSESNKFLEHPNVTTLTLFFFSVFVFMQVAKLQFFKVPRPLKAFSFFIFILSGFLFSCQKKAVFNAALYSGKSMERYDGEAYIGTPSSTKWFEIKDVNIDGNSLYISINYECSCEADEKFELVGSENLNLEVYPPARKATFVILGKPDTCKILRSRTVNFSIRELTSDKIRDVETDIIIAGWRKPIRYVYVP